MCVLQRTGGSCCSGSMFSSNFHGCEELTVSLWSCHDDGQMCCDLFPGRMLELLDAYAHLLQMEHLHGHSCEY